VREKSIKDRKKNDSRSDNVVAGKKSGESEGILINKENWRRGEEGRRRVSMGPH